MKKEKPAELIPTEPSEQIQNESLKLVSIQLQKRFFTILGGRLSKELYPGITDQYEQYIQ